MTSKERENFLRNAILVVDHSKAALVSLVELDVQKKGQTFEQFVNTNQHEIYHLYNSSRCCQCPPGYYPPRSPRILHHSQMELLFDRSSSKLPCHNTVRPSDDLCCCIARSDLCTDILDLTLARCLLVNLCNDVFWFSCLQFQSITFEEFLNNNKHELYHLWKYNVPCCQCPPGYTFSNNYSLLVQNDLMQMFNAVLLPCIDHRKRPSPESMQSICSVAAAPGIRLINLDPSVRRVILQHCCTVRMAVETLVQIRNQDYGHAKEGTISDNDYNTSVVKIERCILDIAKVCNKETQFKQKLREAKDGALDQTLFTQYQNNLMETLTRQADIHQSVADLAPCINKIGKKIAEKGVKFPNLIDECVKKGYDYQEKLMFNQTLVKIKNQTNMEIDCHVKEGTFVETNVIRRFKKWMHMKDVFVIIGSEGTGRSRNGLEILRLFGLTDTDLDLLKVTDFQQVKDILTDERKTVVLLDDTLPFKEGFYACRDRHIGIVETLVQHVDHNLLGMNDVIDHACRSDNLDQVKWLLENIDNTLFDMKTTMNNACYERMFGIVKWLIENVDKKIFNLNEAMNRACVWGKLDIVKWLIENVDNKLFDTKEAMNHACVWGRLDIVKWLIENVDNESFDMKRAMNNVCYTGELAMVKWLIENVDNKLFDMKVAMNDACVWEKLDIVKWLKDNVDNDLFDMKT